MTTRSAFGLGAAAGLVVGCGIAVFLRGPGTGAEVPTLAATRAVHNAGDPTTGKSVPETASREAPASHEAPALLPTQQFVGDPSIRWAEIDAFRLSRFREEYEAKYREFFSSVGMDEAAQRVALAEIENILSELFSIARSNSAVASQRSKFERDMRRILGDRQADYLEFERKKTAALEVAAIRRMAEEKGIALDSGAETQLVELVAQTRAFTRAGVNHFAGPFDAMPSQAAGILIPPIVEDEMVLVADKARRLIRFAQERNLGSPLVAVLEEHYRVETDRLQSLYEQVQTTLATKLPPARPGGGGGTGGSGSPR